MFNHYPGMTGNIIDEYVAVSLLAHIIEYMRWAHTSSIKLRGDTIDFLPTLG